MIIVTAGHVDHGKSALLQALTGTNTAHLPEEKKRGLTIDLGYAYLPITNDSPQNEILGFIDVPGHQKFLSNMLAGLGGVQHALLVISVEEGIKPQTIEHLEILNLLNFKQIIVVLTKADRVEATQITPLIQQIKQQLPSLNHAPFFVTSSLTGEGIAELKAYLIAENQQQSCIPPFRYVIDRVFHIKGAGLVVTGTAVAGKVSVGDSLYLSDGTRVRIKAIHAQNSPSEIGMAGQRLALNLANIEKEQIRRGHWLSELPPAFATDRITVKLTAAQALKETSAVHIYHFASHITGKLSLLNAKQAVKKAEYFAELLLDEPLHIALNDKLIIRSGDDSQTVAGAQVLEIHSPKRYKRSEARLAYLAQLAQTESYAQRISLYLQRDAIARDRLLWDEQLLPAQLEQLGFKLNDEWLYSNAFKIDAQQKVLAKLAEYHELHQDQLGVAKARLRRMALLDLPEKLGLMLIDDLLATHQLAQTRGWLHLAEHRIEFNSHELQIWQQIRPLFEATNQALWVRDIANQLAMDETEMRNLLYKAGKLGYLIPIVKDRFLLTEQIETFAQFIRNFIQQHGEISVNQLRDEIQYGRKLTVQLIEYFDRSGFLRRKGNIHLLRDNDIF
ncbi:selenocysteine-specific translation elongation factor [Actinobacillus vicugnae]|uniref:selenocysteine-specific translation elongation factor n=1 Tax=Actinobacillus vicugnae TaxID=2573093 RepID=UPI001240820A|nr:selenocysteine-specific translation elongation factor [Actinobacillus vicugnae]